MTDDKLSGVTTVAVFALIIPNLAYRAWIGQYLWVWFVEPVFGIPAPSLWLLAGLLLAVGFLHMKTDEPMTDRKFVDHLVFAAVAPALVFVTGWSIQLLAH